MLLYDNKGPFSKIFIERIKNEETLVDLLDCRGESEHCIGQSEGLSFGKGGPFE